MKKIKYGMVGGSLNAFIGEVHRKAINFDLRAELVAGVFSSILERNYGTAEAYGLDKDRVYLNYKEMAEKEGAREDGIDFVSIVTPNHLHYEMSKAFLDAGINVVCEKPLTFTIEEAEELEKIAKEKDLIFGVNYAYSSYTMVRYAKQMIEEGYIGDILTVDAEYAQDWLLDQAYAKDKKAGALSVWRMDPKYSGISNCVGDIGSHIENTVHYLTGLEIDRVLAVTDNFGQDLDMDAKIIVEYTNGVRGSYWSSQIASGRMNGLVVRIYGTKGSIEWEQHFPDYLKYTPKNSPTQTLSRGNGYLTLDAGKHSRIPSGHPEGYFVAFANLYETIISAIIKKNNGEELTKEDMDFPTVTDGLNGVKFVHAVIESAKNDSKWIKL